MRRLRYVAVLFVFAGVVRAQELGPVDWIFLVDTSKSMRGVGGTKDIFGDVKASIDSFVAEANEGDSVAIFTFDRDARLHSAMSINAAARHDLHAIVHSLEAEGNRTHLGAAIEAGLKRAESLRGRADPTRSRAVVLFTDGREDIRGIEDAIPIESNLPRVADTFVFFVSMGEHEPQLDAFAAATERTTVLRAPTVDSIRTVAREIRAKIPAPSPPEPPVVETERVEPPEPTPTWMYALGAGALLGLLALAATLYLWQRKKQNRLEGELEILRPRPAPDAAFVGLPNLQAAEVALSSILPLDVLSGSDARLFVRRRDGRKKVWIAAQVGGLRVNDVETPMSELYDSDTIEIGAAKLRFNRAGDERPIESFQEADL